MRPRLIPRPVEFPGVCATCSHGTEGFGPFVDLGHTDPNGRSVVFCANCVQQILRPLDVVPASKLKDITRAEALAAGYLAEAAKANARVLELEEATKSLTDQLETARSQVASLETSLRSAAKAGEVARREALLAFAAGEPKPKAKEKAAA
jgi:hypothetical protein